MGFSCLFSAFASSFFVSSYLESDWDSLESLDSLVESSPFVLDLTFEEAVEVIFDSEELLDLISFSEDLVVLTWVAVTDAF